ncbi:MAG: hypothetical protein HY719_00285 [Planctomycetes bacterium]|nr:hypothetical protein [Planctomycetota bacterium]
MTQPHLGRRAVALAATIVLAVAMGTLAAHGCDGNNTPSHSDPVTGADQAKRDSVRTLDDGNSQNRRNLVILFSHSTDGKLEMCGCEANQLGSLPRRARAIADERAKEADVLLVEVGGSFAGTDDISRAKAATQMAAWKAMKYDAVNFTPDLLLLGRDRLAAEAAANGMPLVSVALRPTSTPVPVPAVAPTAPPAVSKRLVVTLGGLRVRVIGVTRQSQIKTGVGGRMVNGRPENPTWAMFTPAELGVEQIEPERALRDFFAEEQAAGARDFDLTVLLSDLAFEGPGSGADLADRFAEIDAVVSVVPPVSAMTIQNRGPDGSAPVYNKMLYSPIPLNEGKYLGKATLAIEGGKIVERRVNAIPLSAGFADAAEVRGIIESFYARVRDLPGLEQFAAWKFGDLAPENLPGNAYVGREVCQDCHKGTTRQWMNTKHADAWRNLLLHERQFFPECISCHATGVGAPTGYKVDKMTPTLRGVQCEACHGPGNLHVVNKGRKDLIRRAVDEEFCRRCHDPANSSGFQEPKVRPSYFAHVLTGHQDPDAEKATRQKE